MNLRGKNKYFIGWIGLIAYLFLCLLNFQTVMALSSALAGPHGIEITQDGDHQDIVFTHKHHHKIHAHGHSHHHHQNVEDNVSLLFDNHHESHPDHVIHLAEHQEQISPHVATLHLNLEFLSDVVMPTVVTAPLQHFFETVSLQILPQPPPYSSSILASLRTIILLI